MAMLAAGHCWRGCGGALVSVFRGVFAVVGGVVAFGGGLGAGLSLCGSGLSLCGSMWFGDFPDFS